MPRRKAARGVTLEDVRAILLSLPGVEEEPCYGTPGYRLKKKFLGRIKEDGESLAVKVGFDRRDMLLEMDPETFFVTDHYRGYPIVLVHLSRVPLETLRTILVDAWRAAAPKRMVAAYDAPAAVSAPRRAGR